MQCYFLDKTKHLSRIIEKGLKLSAHEIEFGAVVFWLFRLHQRWQQSVFLTSPPSIEILTRNFFSDPQALFVVFRHRDLLGPPTLEVFP